MAKDKKNEAGFIHFWTGPLQEAPEKLQSECTKSVEEKHPGKVMLVVIKHKD